MADKVSAHSEMIKNNNSVLNKVFLLLVAVLGFVSGQVFVQVNYRIPEMYARKEAVSKVETRINRIENDYIRRSDLLDLKQDLRVQFADLKQAIDNINCYLRDHAAATGSARGANANQSTR